MSVASANFFALLQEEQEPSGVQLEHEPRVAQSTSSKKGDRPPAKADPSRARPKKADPNGNNAAFRDKNAGRAANKEVEVGDEATAHHHRSTRAERTDRQNKGGKRDTGKRVRAGWGDNRKEGEYEASGEEIAREDIAHDRAEDAAAEPAVPTLTLEQYLEQQETSKEKGGLNTRHGATRKPNEGADNAQWADAKPLVRDEVADPSRKKASKPKQRKEVETLELDADLAPPLNASARPPRRENRGPREVREGRPARRDGENRPRREGDRPPRRDGKSGGKPSGKPSGKPAGGKPSGKPPVRAAKPSGPKVDLESLPKLG